MVMKAFLKTLSVIFLFLPLSMITVHADLFVQSVPSTNAGVSIGIDYISTSLEAPKGNLHKVVMIVDDYVIAESYTSSGTLDVTFEKPGSINYIVRSYDADGRAIESIERSINVFGIGMIEPDDNELVGLGSRLFLGASAIFEDALVEYVEFEYRSSGGGGAYTTISGSRDATIPYAYLYEPPSTGLWDIRAVAHHPGGGSTVSAPITLQVAASSVVNASYATILDPSDGSAVQAGILRSVNVDASSSTGTIRGVDLYIDGELINSTEGLDVTFPFLFDWTPLRPGTYSLVAIVTDNAGMKWASDEVEVVATDDRPYAELLLPKDGSTFEVGKQVSLLAIAAGQGGARERVLGVEFLVNGNAIPAAGSGDTFDSEAPYSIHWTPEFPGQYFVQARVVDNVTGASYQTPSVVINTVATTPPAAVMTAPYQGDFFYAGELVELKAVARSNTGLIQNVEFFVNDVSVGEAEADGGTFHLNYRFESPGIYRIRARATADSNRIVDSNTVSITVSFDNGERPAVSFQSPLQGELYTTGDTIQLVAGAFDSDGTISRVAFFLNQERLGEPDVEFPFTYDEFTFTTPGLYRFQAVATDSDGNLSKKAIVEVRAVDPSFVRPMVQITNPLDEATFEVGNTIFVEVDAADEDGNVAEVRFEINGSQIGEPDSTHPFQSTFYSLDAPGLYRVTATAIDNEGYMSAPAKSVFYVVPATDEEGPQFDPLNDNRDFLTQLYIDLFSRGPTDAEANRYLEKLEFGTMSKPEVVEALYETAEFQNLRFSQNAYQAIMAEWPSPLEMASSLVGIEETSTAAAPPSQDDVGDTTALATVLSPEGDVFSGELETIGDVDMFAFQIDVETLVTIFTSGPFDTVGSLENSDGNVLEYDDDSGEFFNFAIQRALSPGIYYISVSGWGGGAGSYTLNLILGEDIVVPQDSHISNAELDATIQFLYDSDAYRNVFGPVQSMDYDRNRREHFSRLFVNRFAMDPTAQQVLQGSNRILASESLASFTASFIRNDRVGLVDYIYNLPDVESRDDAAFLIRSLLKVRPDAPSIEPLVPMTLLEKIETLFESEAYRERFTPTEAVGSTLVESLELGKVDPILTPTSLTGGSSSTLFTPKSDPIYPENPFFHIRADENGWKYVEWLGWISDLNYPWIYHENMGWLQVNTINPEELWVWHDRLDWTYFAAGIYPLVYRYSDGTWVELRFSDQPGDFEIVPHDAE